MQDWHKKVGLTPKVQDWHKTYRIDIKKVKLTHKGPHWQKGVKLLKRVGLTQSGQDLHKNGRIYNICVRLTQNVQDWHKRVKLTQKVHDLKKNGARLTTNG